MKYIITTFLLCQLHLNAQFNAESYRVTLADIETNVFEKDTIANALVIYEQGNSYVHPSDYDLRTEIKHKIKILNAEGFDNANVSIHLYNSKDRSETIDKIVGTTYNKIDGKVIKTQLDKKNIFKDKYDENHTFVKFTLPNIKPGSIITYSYTITSPFMYNYRGWDFQGDIPKLYSEYKTSIPANWRYHIKLVGYKALDLEATDIKKTCLEHIRGASADCALATYGMKDIPAFREEDYMTANDNYRARVEYELETFKAFDGTFNHYTKSWDDVDDELRSEPSIGRQLSKNTKPEEFLSKTIIDEPDDLKRAKAVYNYVQQNYTWNGEYKIFRKHTIKGLTDTKSGNVSSINSLLHNLLKSCNIEVNPILSSTRQNGFPTKIYPVISDFNYLLVQAKINDKVYLLDATDPFLNFGQIPFKCLNHYGRLLDFKNGSSWIPIQPKRASMKFAQINMELNGAGAIKGAYKSRFNGYHALIEKKAYYRNAGGYFTGLQDKYPNVLIENLNVKEQNKTSASFDASFDFELEESADAETLYINPFLFPFFKENPFKLQERTYPVDFGYKDGYIYNLSFTYDAAYELVDIPKNSILKLPQNSGFLSFSATPNKNSINLTFRLEFKESIYVAEFYPYLKEFMNKAIDIQTNSLFVLKKR